MIVWAEGPGFECNKNIKGLKGWNINTSLHLRLALRFQLFALRNTTDQPYDKSGSESKITKCLRPSAGNLLRKPRKNTQDERLFFLDLARFIDQRCDEKDRETR